MLDYILAPLVIGFIVSLILTPLGIKAAKKFKLLDDPKTHKHPAILHKKPIPRAGGLPIFLSIVIGSFVLFSPLSSVFIAVLFSGMLVVIVGLVDDKYDLSPYVRFFMNIVSALIVVASGVAIPFITNPLGSGVIEFNQLARQLFEFMTVIPLPEILAILWIVWVMNMLNWSKGVDGQMPGIAAIAAIIIGVAALRFPNSDESNINSAKMAFLVAGAALGFLPYNFYPARVFPGYSSTILGFMLGVLSITSSVKLATAILVMGVPMTDALFTILRRILSRKSPFWHDKGHLHHLLLQLGLDHRSIALLYWSFSLILGFIALQLSSKEKLFAILLLIFIVSGIILLLKLFTKKGVPND